VLTFYAEHVEQTSRKIFGHVEKMIVGTWISRPAPMSRHEPAIVLFGYWSTGRLRGVELFPRVIFLSEFLDGFYKIAKLTGGAAYQIVM